MRTTEQGLRRSHRTIHKVLDAAARVGASWPLAEDIINEILMELLFREEYQNTPLYVPSDYSFIHAGLAKKGINMPLLLEYYCAESNASSTVPYMTTQVCEKYYQWARVSNSLCHVRLIDG